MRPGIVGQMLASVAILLAATPCADAFTFLGMNAGMTPEQVQAAAPAGFALSMLAAPHVGSGMISNGDQIFANVAFCQNHLVAVSRAVDADTDWLRLTQAGMSRWGQPTVRVRVQPWTGPGGGDTSTFVLRWQEGPDRYEVSLSPEGRGDNGALRYNRGASESFTTRVSPCNPTGR